MIPMTSTPPTKPTTGISRHLPRVNNASIADNMFKKLSHQHCAPSAGLPKSPDVFFRRWSDDHLLGMYLPFELLVDFLSQSAYEHCNTPTSPRRKIRSFPSTLILSTTMSLPLADLITSGLSAGGRNGNVLSRLLFSIARAKGGRTNHTELVSYRETSNALGLHTRQSPLSRTR